MGALSNFENLAKSCMVRVRFTLTFLLFRHVRQLCQNIHMKQRKHESLDRVRPDLATEAYGWDPSLISAGSGKKLTWKCPNGHIYDSMVANRVNGSNCPICLGRRILVGYNDLLTTHPEIARTLVNTDPTSISKGTKKKLKWSCASGHIFQAVVSNRVAGYGCPYCSGNKVLTGFNDLATTNPDLASELRSHDPTTISRGSHTRMKWECTKGHIFENTPNARTSGGQNCQFCSGKQVLKGFNDLGTTDPNLASEMVDTNPENISRGSKKSVTWRCNLGHEYSMSVNERSRNRGCPICAGKRVLVGFNDLQTTHPELANELVDSEAKNVSKGSNKKLRWRCKLGHEYISAVSSRTFGRGCPICAGDKILAGFNDLETTHPEIAKQLINANPKEVSKGWEKSFIWACPTGHSYSAPVKNRVANQNCPYCAGKAVLEGFNDLATTHPEIASELVNGDPTKISKGSVKSFEWKCRLGHIYKSKVNTRTTGPGCPYCSGNKVLVGFNDLLTTHPEIAKQLVDLDPTTLSRGSVTKTKWRCPNNHIWITSPNSRLNHSMPSGCPTCSETGYDPNMNGFLYFLRHESWEMLQIGITNHPDDRTKKHMKLGWEVLEMRGPMDGYLAQQWETAILRMLKAKGADLSNSSIAGKFDGYSEAWSKAKFEAKSLRHLMDLTDAYEETLKKNKKK